MKWCPSCKRKRLTSEFGKGKREKDGLYRYCKECSTTKGREWYKRNKHKNKDKWHQRGRLRRAKYPEKLKIISRRSKYKWKYGITIEQYDKILISQKGVCDICGEKEIAMDKGKIKRLAVDHNHHTDKVRGLLCATCNVGLGSFKDSINVLTSAISYLQKNNI